MRDIPHTRNGNRDHTPRRGPDLRHSLSEKGSARSVPRPAEHGTVFGRFLRVRSVVVCPMSTAPATTGLVTCATTGREAATRVDVSVPDDASSLVRAYRPKFPTVEALEDAARGFLAMEAWDGHEGPRSRVTVAPGAVSISRPDLARRERAHERALRRQTIAQDQEAAYYLDHGEFPPERESTRVIERWSRRSRNRMTEALAQIDYRPLLTPGCVPALLTLTYPGEWLTVAPNGREVKRHLKAFLRRYRRAWGAPLIGIWKLEFQQRGAPHIHIFMVPPRGESDYRVVHGRRPFKQWLSLTWASIVAHPDPEQRRRHLLSGTGIDFAKGLRHRDPKRISIYFTKHSTFSAKEYQNVVPAEWQQPGCGPGRFWGYWHLRRTRRGAEIGPQTAVWAARLMRRYARAQGTTREVKAPRVRGGRILGATWDVIGLAGGLVGARGWSTCDPRASSDRHINTRRVRRRVKRMRNGVGWLSVNDGAVFAARLARAIEIIGEGYEP